MSQNSRTREFINSRKAVFDAQVTSNRNLSLEAKQAAWKAFLEEIKPHIAPFTVAEEIQHEQRMYEELRSKQGRSVA